MVVDVVLLASLAHIVLILPTQCLFVGLVSMGLIAGWCVVRLLALVGNQLGNASLCFVLLLMRIVTCASNHSCCSIVTRLHICFITSIEKIVNQFVKRLASQVASARNILSSEPDKVVVCAHPSELLWNSPFFCFDLSKDQFILQHTVLTKLCWVCDR
jgi:hypothetical protein